MAGLIAFSTIAVRAASITRQRSGEKQRNGQHSRQGKFFHSILLARLIGGIQIGS
jgi:hypothetical protein